jgi:hypothetical protein
VVFSQNQTDFIICHGKLYGEKCYRRPIIDDHGGEARKFKEATAPKLNVFIKDFSGKYLTSRGRVTNEEVLK